MTTELEKLIEYWEKYKPTGTNQESIWDAFISDAKGALKKEKSQLLSSGGFSKFDMQRSFEGGQALVNHEWHTEEFHTHNCNCTPPDYINFKTWFEKYC